MSCLFNHIPASVQPQLERVQDNIEVSLGVAAVVGLLLAVLTTKLWKLSIFVFGAACGFAIWVTFKAFGPNVLETEVRFCPHFLHTATNLNKNSPNSSIHLICATIVCALWIVGSPVPDIWANCSKNGESLVADRHSHHWFLHLLPRFPFTLTRPLYFDVQHLAPSFHYKALTCSFPKQPICLPLLLTQRVDA